MRPNDNQRSSDPERWRDGKLGAAFQAVVTLSVPIPPAECPPVTPERTVRRGPVVLALTVAAAMVLATTVGATEVLRWAHSVTSFVGLSRVSPVETNPSPSPSPARRRRPPGPMAVPPVAPSEMPSSAPTPTPTPTPAPAPAPVSVPSPAPAGAVGPPPSRRGPRNLAIAPTSPPANAAETIAEQAAPPPQQPASPPAPTAARAENEAAVIARAFRTLRRENDPAGALRLLDSRAADLRGGALESEAKVARIEALLSLGRREEALRTLETLTEDRGQKSWERTVLRGELRAEIGRCPQALVDFDTVEVATRGSSSRNDLRARALLGRGVCRARMGDNAAARTAFEQLVRELPTEKPAAAAEKWLQTRESR